ncbi:MAG: RNA 2',3'-cyclic phosphodiesterase [Clostridia bacterium]|nr:RNA 2',3'-cyclic phosphodiesterase [Clostridia bacterium]
MRSFIGIDFSKELKSKIADIQMKLRSDADVGRWKYIDNFHLTLKFLDEISKEQTDDIHQKLEEISERTEKFELRLEELGNFPGKDKIRVVWLSVGGELERLHHLQRQIDQALELIGFEKEKRKYTPHITIAQDVRFRSHFEEVKKRVLLDTLPSIKVDKLYLFKSEQIGNKRVYTPVREYKLYDPF